MPSIEIVKAQEVEFRLTDYVHRWDLKNNRTARADGGAIISSYQRFTNEVWLLL